MGSVFLYFKTVKTAQEYRSSSSAPAELAILSIIYELWLIMFGLKKNGHMLEHCSDVERLLVAIF